MESKNYEILISETAELELIDITLYLKYNLSNPQAADRFWSEIDGAIERIAAWPLAMPIFKNKKIKSEEYRRVNIMNYALLYKICEESNTVKILTIFYAPSSKAEIFQG